MPLHRPTASSDGPARGAATTRGRRARRTAAGTAVVLVLLVVVLWALQRQLTYFPSPGTVPSAGTVVPGARDVTLMTSDGLRLGAWFVPASAPRHSTAVLVANGNAGDRSLRADLARALSRRGLPVLLFDYRGYGGNPGDPSEDGLARDARAARAFLVAEPAVRPDRLLYLGESLGAAVVTELALEHPPCALVLRSPFVDLAAVGQVHYPFLPVRALLRERYPVRDRIADVRAPVSVVYGSRDSIVPAEQSVAVARAAPDLLRLVEVPDADHNDPELRAGSPLLDAVVAAADEGCA